MSKPGATSLNAELTFVSNRERLIALACQIVESRAVAEEIVQESWIRWNGREYPVQSARAVFSRIVTNLAKDWRRSRKVELRALMCLAQDTGSYPSVEAHVLARDELRIILKSIRAMPARHLEVFKLSKLHGMTYKDIASQLELSTSHVHRLIDDIMIEIALALET